MKVSYAQNFEDVVLARALTADSGFYVDIGAYDPDHDSVTKLFYDRGWRGINVEPIMTFLDRFAIERPRDINICAVVSSSDGEQQLWVSPQDVPGHSTLDAEIAAAYASEGRSFAARTVPSLRLDTLFQKFLPPDQTVDFLKIDVEGSEAAVLESWDPIRVRPRVVVVEAFAPHIAGSTHPRWEHLLVDVGYRMTLFDGLNRFYVCGDEPELVETLSVPANIFDEFESAAFRKVRTYADELERELGEWKSWATSLRSHVTWLETRLAEKAAIFAPDDRE